MMIDAGRIEVIDDRMAEVFRAKSPAERLAISNAMYESARQMIESHLAASHPDWGTDRVRRETAGRLSHGAV